MSFDLIFFSLFFVRCTTRRMFHVDVTHFLAYPKRKWMQKRQKTFSIAVAFGTSTGSDEPMCRHTIAQRIHTHFSWMNNRRNEIQIKLLARHRKSSNGCAVRISWIILKRNFRPKCCWQLAFGWNSAKWIHPTLVSTARSPSPSPSPIVAVAQYFARK